MNWSNVKSLAIPVGEVSRDVKRVSIGGSVVWEKPSPLPYDAEVEYLESTGTQYINTGVILDSTCGIDICFAPMESASGVSEHGIFGSSVSASGTVHNVLQIHSSAGGVGLWMPSNTRICNYAITIGDYQHWQINLGNTNNVVVDGTNKGSTHPTTASACHHAVYLFARNVGGSLKGGSCSKMRLASWRVYDGNGNLVQDCIAVRKGTVGYLYDRVSGQLFGNAGTGAFGYGRDTNPISARSYVKDGLVCHMNCREGDFLDLTGNVTRTDTGTVEVTRNGAVYASGVSSALSGLTTSADCSWEFVFTSPETTGNNVVVFNGRTTVDGATTGIDLLFSYLSGTGLRYRIWAASWASGLATFTPNTPQAFGFVRGAGVRESYIRGGNYVQSRSQNDFVPNPNGTAVIKGPVRFYDIRVYNRMLTADEAAINYTVDKALFNVP